jgi:hypothetical protein
MDSIQTFWTWFASRCEYMYSNLEIDTDNIALEVTEHLKAINEDLEFEIPFEFEGDQRELIISADGLLELFDVVKSIVDKAPNFDKWKITAFRPRLHQKNQRIDLDGITMDYHDIFFKYNLVPEGIEIDVYINDYDGTDNRYVHLYFLLLDSLIGEYDSVTYIKMTKVHALINKENLYSFPELLFIIDQIKK